MRTARCEGDVLESATGRIEEFYGDEDPYEPPVRPELVLETLNNSAEENARMIVEYLLGRGFLR